MSAGGVYFVPAFNGLLAPHWRDDARGALLGMSQYTTKAHVARAVLEGIAFQVRDVIAAIEADSGSPVAALRVDGGGTQNDLLMQIQEHCHKAHKNLQYVSLGVVWLEVLCLRAACAHVCRQCCVANACCTVPLSHVMVRAGGHCSGASAAPCIPRDYQPWCRTCCWICRWCLQT